MFRSAPPGKLHTLASGMVDATILWFPVTERPRPSA